MIAAAVGKYLGDEVTGLTYSATTTGGNVFVGWMPSAPDIAVGVMPAGGVPNRTLQPWDTPVVQIIVRGAPRVQRASYDLARAVYDALAGLDNTTLDAAGDDEVFVIGCTPVQSDAVPLGVDDNDRPEWSLNFEIQVHAPTTNRPAHA